MKRLLPSLLAVPLFACPLVAQEGTGTPEILPTTAILNFKDGALELEGTGASVSAILQASLSIDCNAVFVERAELDEILGEQELTLSEAVEPGQVAKIGQLTGAEALVSGRVFPVRDDIYVVAKVMSTSSGRVFGAKAKYEQGGDLDPAIEELAGKIGKVLEDKAGELRGDRSLTERKLDEIRKKTEGLPAPKVHVSVEEQIIRARVIDPAVETELQRTLQKAGWPVVEDAGEADLLVSGEAVAETGTRRGSLWFTRARLEFKVKTAAGDLLKVDRLTTGNVDLTESASGKGALQKAGLLASGLVVDSWLETRD